MYIALQYALHYIHRHRPSDSPWNLACTMHIAMLLSSDRGYLHRIVHCGAIEVIKCALRRNRDTYSGREVERGRQKPTQARIGLRRISTMGTHSLRMLTVSQEGLHDSVLFTHLMGTWAGIDG